MKQKKPIAVLAILLLLFAVGCKYQDTLVTQNLTSAPTGETADALFAADEMYTGEVPYTAPVRTPASAEPGSDAANPPPEAPTEPKPAETPKTNTTKVIGTTPKGYRIVEINGVTYVGDVLIANKTYSLPADYAPGGLTSDCQAAFNELKRAAAAEGLDIFILSGYRSYATQKNLYNRYVGESGKAAADTYSARPGHSEHQTGLAIDVNSLKNSFANTAEGKWLAANAHKYGFIIRYGSDKQSITGYIYEPWHIRYLGTALAQAVYNSGLCLEEYLGIDSVYAD